MVVSAHDVARELRNAVPGDPGDVKIHKLLYYCQGWHLARTGEPLFAEPIEAWLNGPVVAELWRDEKRAHRPSPAALALDAESRHTVEIVVARYGGLTGRELIRRTHEEDPWREVSERDDPGATQDHRGRDVPSGLETIDVLGTGREEVVDPAVVIHPLSHWLRESGEDVVNPPVVLNEIALEDWLVVGDSIAERSQPVEPVVEVMA